MDAESLRTRAVYVISVAAELAGVHPQTLRIMRWANAHLKILAPQAICG